MKRLVLGTLPFLFALPLLAQTTYDAKILEYTGLKYACGGAATPVVRIKNIGTATMSGCVVETWKNGLIQNSFDWQLAIPAASGETRQPALPTVAGLQPGDALEFRIISVNTIPDEDPVGNILSVDMDEVPASATGGTMDVEVSIGSDPASVTWSVKNALAQVVASGGPYEDANATFTENISLPAGGCYTFFAEDATRSAGASAVKVMRDGNTLIHATELASLFEKGLTTGNGVPCTNNVEVEVTTDIFGGQDHWEMVTEGGGAVVCTGGPFADEAGTTTSMCCLPDGCYQLRVYDDAGDGISGGGYLVRVASGARIIDNVGNFTSGSVSAIGSGGSFCLPLGTDRLIASSCDKLDWTNGAYVVANANPAVTAQYGISNATSGYQIWWFDPNGGFSYRRFQSHNTSNGMPASATRAAHFRVNGWSGAQLQNNVLYNVRVRARVNGAYAEWGPACRFVLDPLRAQCPLTNLLDIAGSPYFSCGGARAWGAGNYVHANPVQGANKYQFRFRREQEGFSVTRTSNTYFVQLNWGISPLEAGKTYEVDVRASKDGGATWCTAFIAPELVGAWGPMCTLTITGAQLGGGLRALPEPAREDARMSIFPNPADGGVMLVRIPGAATDESDASLVEIFDLTGKCVLAERVARRSGANELVVDLSGRLGDGMYLVTVRQGATVYTERLVVHH